MPQALNAYPKINGVYDMVMHNYGPDAFNGSVHAVLLDKQGKIMASYTE